MSEKAKAVVEKLAEVAKAIPEEKLEYIAGYVDGMAAMKTKDDEKEEGK